MNDIFLYTATILTTINRNLSYRTLSSVYSGMKTIQKKAGSKRPLQPLRRSKEVNTETNIGYVVNVDTNKFIQCNYHN